MENDIVSSWGGREHFITGRVAGLSDVCTYFEGCTGTSIDAGETGSGVGESEDVVDGEGESSLERLGIACVEVVVRRLLWI